MRRHLHPTSTILVVLAAMILPGCRHAEQVNGLLDFTRQADRLLVVDNQTKRAVEITDAREERLLRQSLEAVIAAKPPQAIGFTCLCYADLVVVWLLKDQRLASFGLQPDPALSWTDDNSGLIQGILLDIDEAYFHCPRSMQWHCRSDSQP